MPEQAMPATDSVECFKSMYHKKSTHESKPTEKYLNKIPRPFLRRKREAKKDKNIQQLVFAGGHPPNY